MDTQRDRRPARDGEERQRQPRGLGAGRDAIGSRPPKRREAATRGGPGARRQRRGSQRHLNERGHDGFCGAVAACQRVGSASSRLTKRQASLVDRRTNGRGRAPSRAVLRDPRDRRRASRDPGDHDRPCHRPIGTMGGVKGLQTGHPNVRATSGLTGDAVGLSAHEDLWAGARRLGHCGESNAGGGRGERPQPRLQRIVGRRRDKFKQLRRGRAAASVSE